MRPRRPICDVDSARSVGSGEVPAKKPEQLQLQLAAFVAPLPPAVPTLTLLRVALVRCRVAHPAESLREVLLVVVKRHPRTCPSFLPPTAPISYLLRVIVDEHPRGSPRVQRHKRANLVDRLVELSWPKYDELPNPSHVAALRGWHRITYIGRWRVREMLRQEQHNLVHSIEVKPVHVDPRPWLLVFEWQGSFAFLKERAVDEEWALHVWSRSRDAAYTRFCDLMRRYRLRRKRAVKSRPVFKVIQATSQGLSARDIESAGAVLPRGELALHYGPEFPAWHSELLQRLRTAVTGLTLLQGPPGTGKTTFLRSLFSTLANSHVFYFIPLTAYPLLSDGAALQFWIDQSKDSTARRVVILEDAEPLLLKRASDNQSSVSNLLNICDGFLSDVLKLHVIATFNCEVGDLDPALLRPGRLIGHYQFRRLTPAEAQQLATAKGRALPPLPDYSLADVYAAAPAGGRSKGAKQIGFSAPAALS